MISFLYHKREQQGGKSHLLFGIDIEGKSYDLFVKFPHNEVGIGNKHTIDFVLPLLTVLAGKLHLQVDLKGHSISQKALDCCSKISDFYAKKDHSSEYAPVTISNYSIQEELPKDNTSNNVGLFFSGGVDSYYSYYQNKDKVTDLLCVLGFDVRYKDRELRDQVYSKIDSFAIMESKRIVSIETNIRELTEEYIHRDMIYGACLGLVAGAIHQDLCLGKVIISSWITNSDHLEGSDPELDTYFSMGNFTIEHFGAGVSRPKKIQTLSQHSGREESLRVCRENRGGSYNCGICEKCTRTLLTFYSLGLEDKLQSFAHTSIGERNFDSIELSIWNKAYYEDILTHFKVRSVSSENDTYLISQLENLLASNDKDISKKSRKKIKNILFIDFNGVISYKPFWHSWRDAKNNDYEIIQKVLFGENIELVKERMVGGKTSEEICLFLADYCTAGYEEILNTLIQDCKTIDISVAIMEQLRRLKPHYHVVLATDNMDCFNRRTLPHNPIIAQTFDHIRDSYTHKHPKKEDGGKAFLSMIDEKNAKIENCILIDDSKNNCKVFEQIGGQAFALNNEQEIVDKLTHIYTIMQTKRLWQF